MVSSSSRHVFTSSSIVQSRNRGPAAVQIYLVGAGVEAPREPFVGGHDGLERLPRSWPAIASNTPRKSFACRRSRSRRPRSFDAACSDSLTTAPCQPSPRRANFRHDRPARRIAGGKAFLQTFVQTFVDVFLRDLGFDGCALACLQMLCDRRQALVPRLPSRAHASLAHVAPRATAGCNRL
jgi:hypothetical protein